MVMISIKLDRAEMVAPGPAVIRGVYNNQYKLIFISIINKHIFSLQIVQIIFYFV